MHTLIFYFRKRERFRLRLFLPRHRFLNDQPNFRAWLVSLCPLPPHILRHLLLFSWPSPLSSSWPSVPTRSRFYSVCYISILVSIPCISSTSTQIIRGPEAFLPSKGPRSRNPEWSALAFVYRYYLPFCSLDWVPLRDVSSLYKRLAHWLVYLLAKHAHLA